jgi:hypothetical protein
VLAETITTGHWYSYVSLVSLVLLLAVSILLGLVLLVLRSMRRMLHSMRATISGLDLLAVSLEAPVRATARRLGVEVDGEAPATIDEEIAGR